MKEKCKDKNQTNLLLIRKKIESQLGIKNKNFYYPNFLLLSLINDLSKCLQLILHGRVLIYNISKKLIILTIHLEI